MNGTAASDRHGVAIQQGAAGSLASRFYQGTILRLYPGSRRGTVRSDSGRDIGFSWQDVRVIGAEGDFGVLREGMRIGFDLGRTSRGVCVTTIRVFAETPKDPAE